MEFSADIATRALTTGSITAPHITLALGEATEPDLLAARSAAFDQRHMRHSSVPRQRT
jgi:hypothetical protein